MKLIHKATTLKEAEEIQTLLENAGIPVSITNKGLARLRVLFVPHLLGVFIYNSSQYKDAMALLNNKNHIVRNPIDVGVFYESINSADMKANAYDAMNRFLLGMVLFGVVCVVLMYAFSQIS